MLRPARMQTFRTANGSSVRVEIEPAQTLRCADSAHWLREALAARGAKAYLPSISVHDPKQRKAANEVVDWCSGEEMKLWSTAEHRFIPSLDILSQSGKPIKLQSVPTANAP